MERFEINNIHARDINANGSITALNIKAAKNIKAENINAVNIMARDIDALDITARIIYAQNIKARDIKAENINVSGIIQIYGNSIEVKEKIKAQVLIVYEKCKIRCPKIEAKVVKINE